MKPSRRSSAPTSCAALLLLTFPLAACDVEPETELDDPRLELDDEEALDDLEVIDEDDALDEDDTPLDAADALAAADDPSAISPGFPVTIEIVGNDVVLTWPQIQDATLYSIDNGASAYFNPGPYNPQGYSVSVGFVWGNFQPQHQFVHVGAATSTTSYNYRIAAFNTPGLPRGYSQTVVKLAQPLVTGVNMVSMPLLDSSVHDGESLHAALGGFAGPLGQIRRFDAWTQTFQDWDPWSEEPGFDFDPGDAFFVHTSGPGNLVMVGHAPANDGEVVHQIVPGWNLVAVPMDLNAPNFPFSTASQIAPLMAGVTQVAEWNPATQSYAIYQHPSGWGSNFSVEANQAIWVQAMFPSIWD